MTRSILSLDDARDLPFSELVNRCGELLEQYDPPDGPETQNARIVRISTTLDEMPQIYRWFLQLQSWCDHWTDGWAQMEGMGKEAENYKRMRQRRDLFMRMASAAKQRYEGASRLITRDIEFDPAGMPRSRS